MKSLRQIVREALNEIDDVTFREPVTINVYSSSPDESNAGSREEGTGDSCPLPTQDLELNTKNRNSAIESDYIEYGPLNLSDEDYWEHLAEHWGTTADVAKQSRCGNCVAFDVSPRMLRCMPGEVEDEDGRLGYCWMHHFKCHSARSCYTWSAGGPITDDDVSISWSSKAGSAEVVSESLRRRLKVVR